MSAGTSVATSAGAENVSARLSRWAAETPGRTAIATGDGRRTSFAALEERCQRLAAGLRRLGLAAGDRTLIFVPPGHELIAVTHALFRIGAVPVLIDPGMGREALLGCVRRIAPRGLIGVPRAHLARALFPGAFRSVELAVTVGRRLGWGGATLAELEAPTASASPGPDPGRAVGPLTEAAILFTSGSTGPPKGVVATHAVFQAQLAALEELYALCPGEVDVACFPLFALFDHALGMTSVFPRLDASRPGRCEAALVFADLERERATFTFGSPAIWTRVLAWARRRGARFTTLRRLTVAGAPVSVRLLAGLRELLPEGGEVHTPYGATEALPVANLCGADLADGVAARSEGGEGTCVGRPAPGIEVRIVPIDDGPLPLFTPDLALEPGALGEVCVRGGVVTPAYALDEEATRAAKIYDPPEPDGRSPGTFWHRMGDVGRFDADGRLWFLGRKSHRLETARGLLLPVPHENVYDTLEGVRKSALVGVGERGREEPLLIVQPERGASQRAVRARVLARAASAGAAKDGLAAVDDVLFRKRLPVDVRHNAKIKRGELKRWAERRLG